MPKRERARERPATTPGTATERGPWRLALSTMRPVRGGNCGPPWAAAGVADAFGEAGLDVHVDVFEGFAEREGAGLDLGGDLGEAGLDVGFVLGGEDADLHQHGGVGEGALDVLPPHLAVEADGGIYLLHDHAGAGGEAATPLDVRLGIAQVGRLGHRFRLILKGRLA